MASIDDDLMVLEWVQHALGRVQDAIPSYQHPDALLSGNDAASCAVQEQNRGEHHERNMLTSLEDLRASMIPGASLTAQEEFRTP